MSCLLPSALGWPTPPSQCLNAASSYLCNRIAVQNVRGRTGRRASAAAPAVSQLAAAERAPGYLARSPKRQSRDTALITPADDAVAWQQLLEQHHAHQQQRQHQQHSTPVRVNGNGKVQHMQADSVTNSLVLQEQLSAALLDQHAGIGAEQPYAGCADGLLTSDTGQQQLRHMKQHQHQQQQRQLLQAPPQLSMHDQQQQQQQKQQQQGPPPLQQHGLAQEHHYLRAGHHGHQQHPQQQVRHQHQQQQLGGQWQQNHQQQRHQQPAGTAMSAQLGLWQHQAGMQQHQPQQQPHQQLQQQRRQQQPQQQMRQVGRPAARQQQLPQQQHRLQQHHQQQQAGVAATQLQQPLHTSSSSNSSGSSWQDVSRHASSELIGHHPSSSASSSSTSQAGINSTSSSRSDATSSSSSSSSSSRSDARSSSSTPSTSSSSSRGRSAYMVVPKSQAPAVADAAANAAAAAAATAAALRAGRPARIASKRSRIGAPAGTAEAAEAGGAGIGTAAAATADGSSSSSSVPVVLPAEQAVPRQFWGLMNEELRPWHKEVLVRLCYVLPAPACYIYRDMRPGTMQRVLAQRAALEKQLRGHLVELVWLQQQVQGWVKQATSQQGSKPVDPDDLAASQQLLLNFKADLGRTRHLLHTLQDKAAAYSDSDYVAYSSSFAGILLELDTAADALRCHAIPLVLQLQQVREATARRVLFAQAEAAVEALQRNEARQVARLLEAQQPAWQATCQRLQGLRQRMRTGLAWRYPPPEHIVWRFKGRWGQQQQRPLWGYMGGLKQRVPVARQGVQQLPPLGSSTAGPDWAPAAGHGEQQQQQPRQSGSSAGSAWSPAAAAGHGVQQQLQSGSTSRPAWSPMPVAVQGVQQVV